MDHLEVCQVRLRIPGTRLDDGFGNSTMPYLYLHIYIEIKYSA